MLRLSDDVAEQSGTAAAGARSVLAKLKCGEVHEGEGRFLTGTLNIAFSVLNTSERIQLKRSSSWMFGQSAG